MASYCPLTYGYTQQLVAALCTVMAVAGEFLSTEVCRNTCSNARTDGRLDSTLLTCQSTRAIISATVQHSKFNFMRRPRSCARGACACVFSGSDVVCAEWRVFRDSVAISAWTRYTSVGMNFLYFQLVATVSLSVFVPSLECLGQKIMQWAISSSAIAASDLVLLYSCYRHWQLHQNERLRHRSTVALSIWIHMLN